MKEIKPCPFCGGKGELNDEGKWGSMWVSCQSCETEGSWVDKHNGKTEDDAIGKWNTRVEILSKWEALKEQLEKVGRTQTVFVGHVLMMMEILEKNPDWDLKRDGMKQEYLK